MIKMKRNICIAALLFYFIMFCGCSLIKTSIETNGKPGTETNTVPPSSNSSERTDQSSSNKIIYYYPFKADTTYIYEGKGNEFASFNKWVDYIKGDKLQERINNGGTEISRVIQNKDGELKLIFKKEESYYREDFTSAASNYEEILLKEPLVKGTSWTLPDGRKRYISNVNVPVTVPSGNYKALEVTTEGKDSKDYDYYAPNIGLVKSLYKAKGMEVTSFLKKIESNTALTQNVKFYYPNSNDEKLYYIEKPLTFKTNDITKLAFEKQFKLTPQDALIRLMGENAKINTMYLNNDGMVYVDFSKEFTSEMNLGASYESLVLRAVANTAGQYYGSNKVYITVNGEPYKSGHILMEKGEAINVNTADSVKQP